MESKAVSLFPMEILLVFFFVSAIMIMIAFIIRHDYTNKGVFEKKKFIGDRISSFKYIPDNIEPMMEIIINGNSYLISGQIKNFQTQQNVFLKKYSHKLCIGFEQSEEDFIIRKINDSESGFFEFYKIV